MIPEYEKMWFDTLALYKTEICSSNIDAILAYFAGRVAVEEDASFLTGIHSVLDSFHHYEVLEYVAAHLIS